MSHLRPYATAKSQTQKRSRSSILKRTFNEDDIIPDDLNDVCSGGACGGRSKRVSFARTYKLKEFIKESDMLTLRSNDATSVSEQLSVAPDVANENRTVYDSVAMEITTMVSGGAAGGAAVSSAVQLEDAGANMNTDGPIEDADFSAFLAAHDDIQLQQPAAGAAANIEVRGVPQAAAAADADVEDNNDEFDPDDDEEDSATRQLRMQRCASRLIGQMHQLLHHELGEQILPMPNYSDTSASSESLKFATATAAAVAAFAVGTSSSSGSSMTMITSSSSATVSQHLFHHQLQSQCHQQQQQQPSSRFSVTAVTDLAPCDISISPPDDEPKRQGDQPVSNGNDSVMERCRELEELFHTTCTALSPGRAAAATTSSNSNAADAVGPSDSSLMAQLERSLFGCGDSMSIATTTCAGLPANTCAEDMSEASIVSQGETKKRELNATKCESPALKPRDQKPPQVANNDATYCVNSRLDDAATPMSLSSERSPHLRSPQLSVVDTPSHLRSLSPTVAIPSFIKIVDFEAASPLHLLPASQTAGSTVLGQSSSNCFAGLDADGFGGRAAAELMSSIRESCAGLPAKFKDVLLNRLQHELERCQVDFALNSLQVQQDDEALAAAAYRQRLGEAAKEIAVKLMPQIFAAIRPRYINQKWPREQLMRLRRHSRQCLMKKTHCLLSAALYTVKAESMLQQQVELLPSGTVESNCESSNFLSDSIAVAPEENHIDSKFLAQCAFGSVQCTVSEDVHPPRVTLQYLHSRLHICCNVQLRERASKLSAAAQTDESGHDVLVQGFSCKVWKEGCTGLYAPFEPLFSSTAKLVTDSLSYCCQEDMLLAEFEQRAYDIVKPVFLLLLDFQRLRRTQCQAEMECIDDAAVAFSFVVMSSSRTRTQLCQASVPPLYRVAVRISLPDVGRFFSTRPAASDACGAQPPDLGAADSNDSQKPDFTVSVGQEACQGLFELVDSQALKVSLIEKINANRRHFLTAAFAECHDSFDKSYDLWAAENSNAEN